LSSKGERSPSSVQISCSKGERSDFEVGRSSSEVKRLPASKIVSFLRLSNIITEKHQLANHAFC
jgi:hypothetical protein